MSHFNTATGLGNPSRKTRIVPDSGIRLFRTIGGGVKGRREYPYTRYRLKIVYDYLDATEAAAVLSHFNSGPTDWHTITIDGEVYDFRYANEPAVVGYHGGDYRTMVIDAEGHNS